MARTASGASCGERCDAREEREALGFHPRGKEVVAALVDVGERRLANACGTPLHGRRTGVQCIGEQEGGRRRVGEAGWAGPCSHGTGGEPAEGAAQEAEGGEGQGLELSFREERKLETGRKVHLAAELGLDPKQVAVWFQNRRARHKSKLMEEEFSKLKHAHDAAILHKCHLENELLRLKERLGATEEEVRRLRSAAGSHGASGNGGDAADAVGACDGSPSSSFSTGTCQQHPGFSGAGQLGPDDELMMCVPEYGLHISFIGGCGSRKIFKHVLLENCFLVGQWSGNLWDFIFHG
ncbi:Homeobox-leucine zipper protein HOX14 [Triticum urartu]|uniref:Homeobox-leucine zipper protein n=1 Tax=Triticum urartu TaxID=4572 RepID=M8AZV7_TRIUA|nr:Homeobox-leucine zipper protein HOX14 [Triticum urartu]